LDYLIKLFRNLKNRDYLYGPLGELVNNNISNLEEIKIQVYNSNFITTSGQKNAQRILLHYSKL